MVKAPGISRNLQVHIVARAMPVDDFQGCKITLEEVTFRLGDRLGDRLGRKALLVSFPLHNHPRCKTLEEVFA